MLASGPLGANSTFLASRMRQERDVTAASALVFELEAEMPPLKPGRCKNEGLKRFMGLGTLLLGVVSEEPFKLTLVFATNMADVKSWRRDPPTSGS
jgi:hypothetical protein